MRNLLNVKINDHEYSVDLDVKVELKLLPVEGYQSSIDGFVMDALNSNLKVYSYEIANKIREDVLKDLLPQEPKGEK